MFGVVSRRVALLIALSSGLGCSAVDPALRDRTTALLEDYRRRTPPPIAAPQPPTARSWAEGQHVVYSVRRSGRVGLVRVVVDEHGAAGTGLTVEELTFERQARWQVRFSRAPQTPDEARTLARRATLTVNGGATRTLDLEADAGPGVLRQRAPLASLWAFALASTGWSATARDVSTPAGQFAAAVATRAPLPLAEEAIEVDAWRHPAVPLGGLVAGGTPDGAATFELVEFGDDGGAPLF